MAFLSLNIEKSSLTIQKDQLEYREMVLSEQLNEITQEMSDITLENKGQEDYDPSTDADMIYLEAQQEMYDSEKESIESQLKELNAEIDGYDKAVDTNIKKDCVLKVSAG